MIPSENEPICPVSYELAEIRLGGGPDCRPSFWKAYREELELNRRTQYRNEHIRICRNHLKSLLRPPAGPLYFRNKRLVAEKTVGGPGEGNPAEATGASG
jgi:hypothetical protein